MKDTYLSPTFVHGSTTQHSSLYTAVKVTTWGFGTKKKNLPLGSALHYVTQALFWLCTQNFECQLTWSDLCSVIRSVIYDPIRDPIQVFSTLSNMSAQSHSQGINQQNFVGPFRYSDWLSS